MNTGDIVKATRIAYRVGLFPKRNAPVLATVVNFKRKTPNAEFLRVIRFGHKSMELYNHCFWSGPLTVKELIKLGVY